MDVAFVAPAIESIHDKQPPTVHFALAAEPVVVSDVCCHQRQRSILLERMLYT